MKILRVYITLLIVSFGPQSLVQAQKLNPKTAEWFENQGNESFGKEDLTEAYNFYLSAFKIFDTENNQEGKIRMLNYLSWLDYESKDILSMAYNAKQADSLAQVHLPELHGERLFALNQLNAYYYAIGLYQESINVLHETINKRKRGKGDHQNIAASYLNIGNNYRNIGDLVSAEEFLLKAKTYTDSLPDDLDLAFDINQAMAIIFQDKNDLDTSLEYLELNEPIFSKLTEIKQWRHNFYLAENALSRKDLSLATRPINNLKKEKKLIPYYKIRLLENEARIYELKGDYKSGQDLLVRADSLASIAKKRNTLYHRIPRNIDLARLSVLNRDTIGSINFLLKTLEETGFDTFSNNNRLEELPYKSKNLLLLDELGKNYNLLYKSTNSIKDLRKSLDYFISCCELVYQMRREMSNAESKNILATKSHTIFESAVLTSFELYSRTGQKEILKEVWSIMENNKAQLLLENLFENQAQGIGAVPKTLIEKMNELTLQISYLRNQKEEGNTIDNDVLGELIFEKNELILDLEKNYPRYHKLKYQDQINSLEKIQSQLRNNNLVLEYFWGLDSLYAIGIKKSSVDFLNLGPVSELSKEVDMLVNELKSPQLDRPLEAYYAFSEMANSFYQKLISPFSLDAQITGVTIIPDGPLNRLPFEVLIKEKIEKPGYRLSDQQYLFEDFVITYQYSMGFDQFISKLPPIEFENDLVGFAPVFEGEKFYKTRSCEDEELSPLKCNIEEVESISKPEGSQSFIGNDASVERFLEIAPTSKIIHLATHACVDEENSNNSRIFFQGSHFSHIDLQVQKIPTELIVLSACNTGRGKYIEGEGAMSLARDFLQAGAKSTVMSMWAVDDCATSDIVQSFYKHLRKGQGINEALQLAKVQYLNSADKTKLHPYYWAALVGFGETNQVLFEKNYRIYLLGLFPILLFIFFILKKSKA